MWEEVEQRLLDVCVGAWTLLVILLSASGCFFSDRGGGGAAAAAAEAAFSSRHVGSRTVDSACQGNPAVAITYVRVMKVKYELALGVHHNTVDIERPAVSEGHSMERFEIVPFPRWPVVAMNIMRMSVHTFERLWMLTERWLVWISDVD